MCLSPRFPLTPILDDVTTDALKIAHRTWRYCKNSKNEIGNNIQIYSQIDPFLNLIPFGFGWFLDPQQEQGDTS